MIDEAESLRATIDELLAANSAVAKIGAEALRRGARLHREVKEAMELEDYRAVHEALGRWGRGDGHQSPTPGDPS